MDFQYFYFLSIFTTFLILSNKNALNYKNHLKWHSKHIEFGLLFYHPVWAKWYQVILEIKATFIMSILIPYIGWSDHWLRNNVLMKRNNLLYRFVTFDLFKRPENQAGLYEIIDSRSICMLWFISVKMRYYIDICAYFI